MDFGQLFLHSSPPQCQNILLFPASYTGPEIVDFWRLVSPFCLGSALGNILQGERWFHNGYQRHINVQKLDKKGHSYLTVWMKWEYGFVFTVGPWLRFCFFGFGNCVMMNLTFIWLVTQSHDLSSHAGAKVLLAYPQSRKQVPGLGTLRLSNIFSSCGAFETGWKL